MQARMLCKHRLPSRAGTRYGLPLATHTAFAQPSPKRFQNTRIVSGCRARSFPVKCAGSTEPQNKPAESPQRNTFAEVFDGIKTHGLQTVVAASVAVALVLSTPAVAWAARSGGRVGGSSFGRSMGTSRSSAPRQSYTAPPLVGTTILPSVVVPVGGFYPSYGFGFGYGFGLTPIIVLMVLAMVFVLPNLLPQDDDDAAASGDVTVAKVQVGLLAQARELKTRLDRLGSMADTSTSEGLSYILQETVLALMRNPSYCAYASAYTSLTSSEQSAERKFNKISLQERSKFEQETLVNVGGGRVARSQYRNRGLGSVDELIVVTLVVAASGEVKLPKITSLSDLKTALSTLGGLAVDQVIAVEVLWTPQAEGDYFTRDEIISDYPDLINL